MLGRPLHIPPHCTALPNPCLGCGARLHVDLVGQQPQAGECLVKLLLFAGPRWLPEAARYEHT